MDEGSNPYQEEIGFGAARHLQERLLLLRRAALKLLVGEVAFRRCGSRQNGKDSAWSSPVCS